MKIWKLLQVASAAFFFGTSAFAQNPGAVTNHAFAIGKGPGQTGFTSLLCGSAQLAVGQAAAAPICRTIGGDATLAADGTLTIANDAVSNAKLRDSAALSVIGRSANSTGDPGDIAAGSDHNILRRSGTSLGFGSIDLSQSGAVGSSVLAAGNGGTGLSALGSGVATWLGTPSSANLAAAVTGETGSGALVFATSPTLVTPALGTPSSGTLTNATGLPISTGVSGLGSGIATFLATPSSANLRSALTDEVGTGAAYFVGGALGTPASGTLTNATGLPVSTGISGLGSNVATWLATPSSANLASALTDETGSGLAVFSAGPTFTATVAISEALTLAGDISPAQLTSNTNDWAPTGFATASAIRFSTDASRNITGIAGGADGRIIILHNIGSQDAVLKNEDANSTAANRFVFGGDVTLLANYSITLRYDATSSRWRAITTASAGGGGGGTVTSAQIVGAGLTVNSGTCTITTSGTCTLTTTSADATAMQSLTSTATVAASAAFPRLIGSGTAAAVSTLDIVIPTASQWKGIKVYLSTCVPVTNDAQLFMRVSTNAGSSWVTSADYHYVGTSMTDTSTTVSGYNNNADTSFVITPSGVSNNTALGMMSELTMFGISAAVSPKVVWNNSVWDGSTRIRQSLGSGGLFASQDTDAIQFRFSSGNISTCTWAVYGFN